MAEIQSVWIEPKTNWQDNDSFNLNPDYNRIRNNIYFVRDSATELYGTIDLADMKLYEITDFPTPDLPNTLVNNINAIRDSTFSPIGWGNMRSYVATKPGWKAEDLNTIEGNLGILKAALAGQKNLLPQLAFALGGSEF